MFAAASFLPKAFNKVLFGNKVPITEDDECMVMVGIHGKRTRQFMANFTSQMRRHNLFSSRKFKEPFFDDKNIYTFYYSKLSDEIISDFSRELNTIVMLPEHPISRLFTDGIYSSQTAVYAISAATFTNQFISVLTDEYISLSHALKDQPEAKGILDKMKLRLVKDTYTESKIAKAVMDHQTLVALIYQDFVNRLHPGRQENDHKIHQQVKRIESMGKKESIFSGNPCPRASLLKTAGYHMICME